LIIIHMSSDNDDCYPVIVDIMLAHELIPASNLIIAVVRRVDIVDACVLSACSVVGLQGKVTTHRDKKTQHTQHRQHCTIGIIYLVFSHVWLLALK